jgi:D-tyrosyl-tRNA(Tyr) deacylase
MTNRQFKESEQLQEQFGREVAKRLSDATAELPYHITERLRAARAQALARHRIASVAASPTVVVSGNTASLGGWWRQVAAALPLLVLAGGLVLIHSIQNDYRASEVAEVDAALLTDDLPPDAYADPGFAQFLKSGRN